MRSAYSAAAGSAGGSAAGSAQATRPDQATALPTPRSPPGQRPGLSHRACPEGPRPRSCTACRPRPPPCTPARSSWGGRRVWPRPAPTSRRHGAVPRGPQPAGGAIPAGLRHQTLPPAGPPSRPRSQPGWPWSPRRSLPADRLPRSRLMDRAAEESTGSERGSRMTWAPAASRPARKPARGCRRDRAPSWNRSPASPPPTFQFRRHRPWCRHHHPSSRRVTPGRPA